MELTIRTDEAPVTEANPMTFDPSLLELFRAEIDLHLPALGEGLLALEKDPRDAERLESMMRAAHSIKGAAKIVGVEPAVRIAHAMEDCFVAAQGGDLRLDGNGIDALLRGVDALQRIAVPEASDKGTATEDEVGAVLQALAAVRSGRPPAPTAPAGPPTVRPGGNLDAAEAESVRARLAELLRARVPMVRLDMAAVENVGPAGVALLALAARGAGPTALELVNVQPSLRLLLRATRLDQSLRLAAEVS
jgi:two-component system sensor histidine kinase and response regulator WspE